VREIAGYVLADERGFHWRLSGEENLEFFATLNGIHGTATRTRIHALLRRLDLLDAARRGFAEYSTGMKQRLAIARALPGRPRVLLMDEPTRSIDPGHTAEVWRPVRDEVAAADGCVVLVTHQVQEALSLCSRIALDTTPRQMESFALALDGFTISVRNLPARDLDALRAFPGVRDIRITSQVAGEQVLEVWTHDGDLPLASFIGELTGAGATICLLQWATPLRGVLERVLAAGREQVYA
jgi:ABC-type taurine transport system ATPase subunit